MGGAGFIGSYCVDELLKRSNTELVRVYDNFSSGQRWHLEDHLSDSRLEVIAKDIYDDEIFTAAKEIDCVYMFAANPDIAKAVSSDYFGGDAKSRLQKTFIRFWIRCLWRRWQ